MHRLAAVLIFISLAFLALACGEKKNNGSATPTVASDAAQPENSESQSQSKVRAMQLIDETRGWVLTGKRLSFTADGGASWTNATPPGITIDDIRSVFFVDASRGWVAAFDTDRG